MTKAEPQFDRRQAHERCSPQQNASSAKQTIIASCCGRSRDDTAEHGVYVRSIVTTVTIVTKPAEGENK